MTDHETPKSLCNVDLFKAASNGDDVARLTLETAWNAGGFQTAESTSCITPCILGHCGVKLTLDFEDDGVSLGQPDDGQDGLDGVCTRKNKLLNMAVQTVKAKQWPDYTENDIKPTDPDFMDL